MKKPLLDDIKMFIEIARTGSFKRAALALEMPAATLSRRIADLESRIGLKLLNRSTRSVHLTTAGQAYLDKCGPLVDAMLLTHEQISETVAMPKGTLRLTCTPDFAAFYLPSVIKRYIARHPQVEIQISTNSSIDDLASHNFDLAIRMGVLAPSDLVGRQIATLQHVLCAAPAYLKSAPPLRQPEDLQQHHCIRINAGSNANWHLSHADHGQRSIPVSGQVVAGSPYMCLALALEGLGLALVDSRIIPPHIASGKLQRVLTDWTPAGVAVNVLTPSRLMPPSVRVFIEHLQQSLT